MSATECNLNRKRWRLAAILVMGLSVVIASGCERAATDVLTMEVVAANFKADIPAAGALEASTSTRINVPPGLQGPQSLAWIMDNFSEVKAGEVIARMDSARESFYMEIEQFQFDRLGLDGRIQGQKDQTIAGSLNTDSRITLREQQLAERFFSDDERVYTKIEIIEQMRDQVYLEAKRLFYDWSSDEHSTQAEAEQALIKMKQKSHAEKINRYANNLNQLEVVAPHDGLFVAEPHWHGGLPVAGDMLWSGMTIGTLPDTSKMQARLHVLESEALGLTLGRPVTLYLDAYPEMPIQGRVAQLDTLAKPRVHDSPVNYFALQVAIDKTIPELMRPGRQVKAKVHILDLKNVITVPNQALFHESGRYWVYRQTAAGFVEQAVTPGRRSLNRTVIADGLSAGDIIALTAPPQGSRV